MPFHSFHPYCTPFIFLEYLSVHSLLFSKLCIFQYPLPMLVSLVRPIVCLTHHRFILSCDMFFCFSQVLLSDLWYSNNWPNLFLYFSFCFGHRTSPIFRDCSSLGFLLSSWPLLWPCGLSPLDSCQVPLVHYSCFLWFVWKLG